VQMPRVRKYLLSEIKEYDDFLTGNVWGYVITKPCAQHFEHGSDEDIAGCPHSETIDSRWGYVGDPEYAWNEAKSEAEAIH
ncbi:MAG TPA: hypothetical protein VFB99_20180, partial [Vicinamibacterales bacterium]|nr:hypothetical protein [Vicinamibacterales bacterium]